MSGFVHLVTFVNLGESVTVKKNLGRCFCILEDQPTDGWNLRRS